MKIDKITYEPLKTLDNKLKYLINAESQTDDGKVQQVGYMLTGIELDPDYMTTDRLYELLYDYYESCRFCNFGPLLGDFVKEFITHIRMELPQ